MSYLTKCLFVTLLLYGNHTQNTAICRPFHEDLMSWDFHKFYNFLDCVHSSLLQKCHSSSLVVNYVCKIKQIHGNQWSTKDVYSVNLSTVDYIRKIKQIHGNQWSTKDVYSVNLSRKSKINKLNWLIDIPPPFKSRFDIKSKQFYFIFKIQSCNLKKHRYNHATWKSTDKWSLMCFKSILKIPHSQYL